MKSLKPVKWRWMAVLALSVASLLAAPASSAVVPAEGMPNLTRSMIIPDEIPASCSQPVDRDWIAKVNRIRWVAYSSPDRDTSQGSYQPLTSAIYQDLLTLRKAGFTGLVTYGSTGILGKQLLAIAQSLGYKGVILGIWNPKSQEELNAARNAAANPIVLGYSIGNEGLSAARPRYSALELCEAIATLRAGSGKPVTTSEPIEAYYRWPALLSVGDWLFPNAHPYWHFTKYALEAVRWGVDQYAALSEQTDRFVFFKEVGLPTSGAYGLSEANQDLYYRELAKTKVRFAYFEAYDQPTKTHAAVEPHWGIFHADLSPKLLGWNLMGYRLFTMDEPSRSWVEQCSRTNDDACVVRPSGSLLLVGDDRQGRQYRAVLSFDTASLPEEAGVTSIKLRVKAAGIVGADPLNQRRKLLVDICTPPVDKPVRYQNMEFKRGLSCNDNVGTFSGTPSGGWYTIDLQSAAFRTLNLQGSTLLRLRIDGSGVPSGARAYIQFYTGEADSSSNPMLLVRYDLP